MSGVLEGGNARCIDHDHDTGIVRGVLCSNCNKVEGFIRNITPNAEDWIDKMRAYLKGSRCD